jgi:hypothetical protein
MQKEPDAISKDQWTGLPSATRIALRKRFDLRPSESPQVVDDRVISDGISIDTLRSVFNEDKMREHLGKAAPEDASCTDLFRLIVADTMTEASAEARPVAAPNASSEPVADPVEGPKPARKPGKRKPKAA